MMRHRLSLLFAVAVTLTACSGVLGESDKTEDALLEVLMENGATVKNMESGATVKKLTTDVDMNADLEATLVTDSSARQRWGKSHRHHRHHRHTPTPTTLTPTFSPTPAPTPNPTASPTPAPTPSPTKTPTTLSPTTLSPTEV